MNGKEGAASGALLKWRVRRPHPEHTPGRRHHYTWVGIGFHWTMAALIFVQLLVGWWSTWAPAGYSKVDIYRLHSDIGLVILILAGFRLTWRVFVRGPEETVDLPEWQYWASRITYWSLYALMFALPLTGWLMLSATAREMELAVFSQISWPHMAFLAESPLAVRATWEERAENLHEFLVWSLLALLVLHIGAAVKHQIDGDAVLSRMAPWVARRRGQGRPQSEPAS